MSSATSAVQMLRLWLALAWMQICRYVYFVFVTLSLPRSSEFAHKVVIVGDDFALGLGDRAVLGRDVGIARYLQPLIASSGKVRHRWDIVNCGKRGSTASDWAPNAAKQYYNKVFGDRRTGDAEIVIVLLGSTEQRDSSFRADATCKHLMALCDALRKKDRAVCLATVASVNPAGQDTADTGGLNKLIEEYCTSTKGDDIPVVLGPRLDAFGFRRSQMLASDKFHFNASAYKLLARNTADFLIPTMTAIEWKTWKTRLSNIEYDKALYD